MTGEVDFDAERLLEVLVDEAVEFVIIGGYAALTRGASRPTQDVDVAPATTKENLARLVRALERLEARIRTDAVPEGLPFSTSPEALLGVLTLNLSTKYGALDLAFEPAGTDGYRDLARRSEERRVGRVHIQVAALADVVRSKEAAGRAKDLQALPELYALMAAEKKPPAGI